MASENKHVPAPTVNVKRGKLAQYLRNYPREIVRYLPLSIPITILGLMLLPMPWNAPPAAVDWREGYEAAAAEARETGKPLLLVFSAWWCPPCNEMKHEVWPDEDVGALANSDYIPVMINRDRHEALAAKYGVPSIPRIFIVDVTDEEEVVLAEAGYLYVDELWDLLAEWAPE